MGMMTSTGTDLRTNWLNVARRLQSVAKSQGLSILEIRVLVDADGEPLGRMEPTQIKIEPKSCGSTLVAMLTQGMKGL